MFLVPFATSAVERLVLVPRGWLFRVLLRLKGWPLCAWRVPRVSVTFFNKNIELNQRSFGESLFMVSFIF